RALAQAEGVEEALLEEWRLSLPDLAERSVAASRSAMRKGWRWVGEMNEIADSYASAGLPDGFHRAAAEIYRRASVEPDGDAPIDRVFTGIRDKGDSQAYACEGAIAMTASTLPREPRACLSETVGAPVPAPPHALEDPQ